MQLCRPAKVATRERKSGSKSAVALAMVGVDLWLQRQSKALQSGLGLRLVKSKTGTA